MFSRSVAVRLLIPAAAVIAEKNQLKCKPSELPIYTPDTPKESMKVTRPPGPIERQIGNVRKQLMTLAYEVESLQQKAGNLYSNGTEQLQGLVDYLQQPDNTAPKAGAIAVGGLAGLILGLRGKLFRKVLFTGAGALGMAAVCYPTEAAYYSDIAKTEAMKYFQIAYNFYHGVKKDDPPLELPSLPKIPTSPSEIWSSVTSLIIKNDTVADKVKDNPPTTEQPH